MNTMHDGQMVVYWNDKGQVLSCGSRQASVMTLLIKLGLKSVPIKDCTTWTTTWSLDPGVYVTSYTVSGNTITLHTTVPAPTFIMADVSIKTEDVAERKPTKDMRRQWRQTERMHSRNTGRKTGRR